ncbi:putative ubiquinol-cytochrome C reductase complex [Hyaloraphidium curvatum]|nr:putative ubiquinol-cytochrome C reductase complex [Hyaloraphidium curvatum]
MALHWGKLPGLPQMGIWTYALSPMRQRVTAGLFSKSLFNAYRRTLSAAPYVVPPLLLGMYAHDWANAKYEEIIRAGVSEE